MSQRDPVSCDDCGKVPLTLYTIAKKNMCRRCLGKALTEAWEVVAEELKRRKEGT